MKTKILPMIFAGALCLMTACSNGAVPEAQDATTSEPGTNATETSVVTPINMGFFEEEIAVMDTAAWKTMAEYSWYAPKLYGEEAEAYPALSKTFEKIQTEGEKGKNNNVDILVESYGDFYSGSEEDEDSRIHMSSESKARVLRADTNIVSIWEEYSDYTGGAHGNYGYFGSNFDTASGKELEFSDIVLNEDRFYELVDEKLRVDYEEIYEDLGSLDEYRKSAKENEIPLNIAVDNQGVIAIFNPYDIAPYALSSQIVRIPFREAPEIFAEKYQKTPDRFIMSYVPELFDAGYDINNDGTPEKLYFFDDADEYGSINTITVSLGNRSVEIENFSYGTEYYLMYQGGNYYGLILASVEGYTSWYVVDLNTMKSTQIEGFSGSLGYDPQNSSKENLSKTREKSTYSTETYAITDPDYMILSPHVELLGNAWNAKGEFALKTNPISIEDIGEYYTVKSTAVIRANRDVPCRISGPDGVKEDQVIPKGTYLTMVFTDGKTWAELQEVPKKLVDGEEYMYLDNPWEFDPKAPVYRIEVDPSGEQWYRMVDGENEMDVFSGIIYAG